MSKLTLNVEKEHLERIENQILFLSEALNRQPAMESHTCDGLSMLLSNIAREVNDIIRLAEAEEVR